jgi:hypothetical protein
MASRAALIPSKRFCVNGHRPVACRRRTTAINTELIGQSLAAYKQSADVLGENRLLKQLAKVILEPIILKGD